jgi:hypothetical protein
MSLFEKAADYLAFEQVLWETVTQSPMRVCAGNGNGDAISLPAPSHLNASSVQPVLDPQSWHSFEIGSVG